MTEQTTEPSPAIEQATTQQIQQQGRVIADGIELIRRMTRAQEPWAESDVREWVQRARQVLHANDT